MTEKTEQTEQTMLQGRRAVVEALRAGRPVDRVFVLRSGQNLADIIRAAKEAGAVVVECPRPTLDRMCPGGHHQGVAATVAAWEYAQPDDIFAAAEQKGEPLFLIVCDGVQDEGNLGAIIRTAEVCGAHGVVIPKRRSAGLTPLTARSSAGAVEHIPVARVPGIPSFLRELRERGVWVYGAAGEASQNAFSTNFSGPAALVLGGEEDGLGRLAREECDALVALPMKGLTGSLNVSCAAAVLMYEIARGRFWKE